MHTERLYYSDSFLSAFTAEVAAVRQLAGYNNQPLWQLSLNRTAFYPTSGGQPLDVGVLRISSPGSASSEIPVEYVTDDEDGSVCHLVRQPLEVGTRVEASINWDRRFDHMQQHT